MKQNCLKYLGECEIQNDSIELIFTIQICDRSNPNDNTIICEFDITKDELSASGLWATGGPSDSK